MSLAALAGIKSRNKGIDKEVDPDPVGEVERTVADESLLILLCEFAELITPDVFVYHDRFNKTILRG